MKNKQKNDESLYDLYDFELLVDLCLIYLWIKLCSSFVKTVLPFSGDSFVSASRANENISFEKKMKYY